MNGNESNKKNGPSVGGVVTVVVVFAVLAFACRCSKSRNAVPFKDTPLEEVAAHDGTINGHEYVDLGLSVKWATRNVGTESPEDYGNYYAWGEIRTKGSYDTDNCETWEKEIGDIGGTNRDVARVRWGGSWRMPTKAEILELIENCDYEWTSVNGVRGGKFTSRENGKSIFLPAAGERDETSLNYVGVIGRGWSPTRCKSSIHDASLNVAGVGSGRGWSPDEDYAPTATTSLCYADEIGSYWSSTPNESSTMDAYYLCFSSDDHDCDASSRSDGYSIRPVSE